MNSRDDLIQQLKDPQFAAEYFFHAAIAGDLTTLETAVKDIMETGCYRVVELTKLRVSPNATEQPGSWDKYRLGDVSNNVSLPVDYRLTGILLAPPRVGENVRILRVSRNGVVVPGAFTSTTVVAVEDNMFTTRNSVYRMRQLNHEESLL